MKDRQLKAILTAIILSGTNFDPSDPTNEHVNACRAVAEAILDDTMCENFELDQPLPE
jgi:hypothetical protein